VTVAPAVVFRADASTAIGMGHAMRCLALAQAFADQCGGRSAFLMADAPPAFAARALGEDATVTALGATPGTLEDAAETVALARLHGAGWVVADGYHLDGGYQRALVDAGVRVLALDDHAHLDGYQADLVLNQNLGADPEAYRDRAPRSRLLVGPRYALLRREFRTFDDAPRDAPATTRRILVTLGGSDPDDVSARVVAALAQIAGPLEIELLAGSTNPNLASLERAAAAGLHPVELVVDAHDMPHRMAAADLAVTAAGTTSWELARIGTPQVAIVLADNQRPVARGLEAEGLAVSLGWHADLTHDRIAAVVGALAGNAGRRAEMSRRGRELIDGRGALRVLAAMGLTA
jgi:UDP-2,4-diacetamido-2,4,6-trideoxy-beta-L-altropyranose hydrolase